MATVTSKLILQKYQNTQTTAEADVAGWGLSKKEKKAIENDMSVNAGEYLKVLRAHLQEIESASASIQNSPAVASTKAELQDAIRFIGGLGKIEDAGKKKQPLKNVAAKAAAETKKSEMVPTVPKVVAAAKPKKPPAAKKKSTLTDASGFKIAPPAPSAAVADDWESQPSRVEPVAPPKKAKEPSQTTMMALGIRQRKMDLEEAKHVEQVRRHQESEELNRGHLDVRNKESMRKARREKDRNKTSLNLSQNELEKVRVRAEAYQETIRQRTESDEKVALIRADAMRDVTNNKTAASEKALRMRTNAAKTIARNKEKARNKRSEEAKEIKEKQLEYKEKRDENRRKDMLEHREGIKQRRAQAQAEKRKAASSRFHGKVGDVLSESSPTLGLAYKLASKGIGASFGGRAASTGGATGAAAETGMAAAIRAAVSTGIRIGLPLIAGALVAKVGYDAYQDNKSPPTGDNGTNTQSGQINAGPVKQLGTGDRQQQAMSYFMDQGYTKDQAAGIVGNLMQESGGKLNHKAKGDFNKITGKNDAYGIAQWHPDRQRKFKKLFGKDIQDSSFEEQLAFQNWELSNTEKSAGQRLKGAKSATEAAAIVDKHYERSDGKSLAQRQRNATVLASAPVKSNTASRMEVALNDADAKAVAQKSNPTPVVISGGTNIGGSTTVVNNNNYAPDTDPTIRQKQNSVTGPARVL